MRSSGSRIVLHEPDTDVPSSTGKELAVRGNECSVSIWSSRTGEQLQRPNRARAKTSGRTSHNYRLGSQLPNEGKERQRGTAWNYVSATKAYRDCLRTQQTHFDTGSSVSSEKRDALTRESR